MRNGVACISRRFLPLAAYKRAWSRCGSVTLGGKQRTVLFSCTLAPLALRSARQMRTPRLRRCGENPLSPGPKGKEKRPSDDDRLLLCKCYEKDVFAFFGKDLNSSNFKEIFSLQLRIRLNFKTYCSSLADLRRSCYAPLYQNLHIQCRLQAHWFV